MYWARDFGLGRFDSISCGGMVPLETNWMMYHTSHIILFFLPFGHDNLEGGRRSSFMQSIEWHSIQCEMAVMERWVPRAHPTTVYVASPCWLA